MEFALIRPNPQLQRPNQGAIPRGTVSLRLDQAIGAMAGLLSSPSRENQLLDSFEAAFAEFIGVRNAIAISSGKAAFAAILRGLGAEPGDGIVLSAYNVPEVFSLLVGLGLRPILVDIDMDTFNLDLEKVDQVVDDRTHFLLVTHLYGCPLNANRVHAKAEQHGLQVIEDCAQALGASSSGKRVGAHGWPALFSFGPMKSLSTLKGGMVVTEDASLASSIRRTLTDRPLEARRAVLRTLVLSAGIKLLTQRRIFSMAVFPLLRAMEKTGQSLVYKLAKMRPAAYESGRLDPASILHGMRGAQAAAGRLGLPAVLPAAVRRIHNAEQLRDELEGLPELRCQAPAPGTEPVWTNFVISTPKRDELRRALLEMGVDTTMGYLSACHRLPTAESPPGGCPNGDRLASTNLYLPIGEGLDSKDMEYIATTVRRFFS